MSMAGDLQGVNWNALVAKYPTFPGDYQAVPEPRWDARSDSMSHVGAERARASRSQVRRPRVEHAV